MNARIQLGAAFLSETLSVSSAAEATVLTVDAFADEPTRATIWIRGADPAPLQRRATDDPTVERLVPLADADRQLYLVYYPAGSDADIAYESAVSRGGTLYSSSSTGQNWTSELSFPDRSSFASFVEDCERHGMSVSIDWVRSRGGPNKPGAGLPEAQRRALQVAFAKGYFAVPQECSLADVAAELDVSSPAASERLSRGISTLIEDEFGPEVNI